MYKNLNSPNQTYDVNHPVLHFIKVNLYKIITVLIIVLLFFEYVSYFYLYSSNYNPNSTPNYSSARIDEFYLENKYKLRKNYELQRNSSNKLYLVNNNQTKNYLNSSTFDSNSSSTSQPSCPVIPSNLAGNLKVMKEILSFDQLDSLHPELDPGGHYKPKECEALQKIAIIIPYRNREKHLKVFLHNIHPFLQKQQAEYSIYVIEQNGDYKFNRAKLFNIGFVESLKQYNFDCFIFHDVDLIPEDDRNFYRCFNQPRHLSVAIDTMGYKLPYAEIFGGVSALSKSQMIKLNGFSNKYWGWGGEDDDMAIRIKHNKYKITRYKPDIARYTMLSHAKEKPNSDRYKVLYKSETRISFDGLNNLEYKRIDLIYKKTYTWVLVDVLPPIKL